MNENNVRFGTGVKVWLIICIVATTFSALGLLSQGFSPMVIPAMIAVGLTIWLLISKKKLAFYLIVAVTVIICVLNLVVYKIGIFAFLGLINPLITYAFISKYWDQMD